MKFRFRNFGCINIFLSGLVTAITINYLATGFIDFILNIDKLLQWMQKSGFMNFINQIFGSR